MILGVVVGEVVTFGLFFSDETANGRAITQPRANIGHTGRADGGYAVRNFNLVKLTKVALPIIAKVIALTLGLWMAKSMTETIAWFGALVLANGSKCEAIWVVGKVKLFIIQIAVRRLLIIWIGEFTMEVTCFGVQSNIGPLHSHVSVHRHMIFESAIVS